MLRDPDCIFCKIHAGELPATIVNRADGLLAIEDINPKADVHLLVIPEQHIETFRDIGELDEGEAKAMLDFVARHGEEGRPRRVPADDLLRRGRGADRLPSPLARSRRPLPRDAGVSVARLRLAPVGETMFPPRFPFFQGPIFQGNLPVSLGPLPAHRPEAGR